MTHISRQTEINNALNEANNRIKQILLTQGRNNARLVAVTKTKPSSDVQAAYTLGQRHFGENYVNELVEKSKLLPDDIQWHFIGTLQSNKCKILAGIPNLYVVETIDSTKTADLLDKACATFKRSCRVFVQVNTSGEKSKSGIEPKESLDLARHIAENCPNLTLAGLMTIGARGRDESGLNPDFTCLGECKKQIDRELKMELELSMGMSEDFEQALLQQSNNVRLGSTIFGRREPK